MLVDNTLQEISRMKYSVWYYWNWILYLYKKYFNDQVKNSFLNCDNQATYLWILSSILFVQWHEGLVPTTATSWYSMQKLWHQLACRSQWWIVSNSLQTGTSSECRTGKTRSSLETMARHLSAGRQDRGRSSTASSVEWRLAQQRATRQSRISSPEGIRRKVAGNVRLDLLGIPTMGNAWSSMDNRWSFPPDFTFCAIPSTHKAICSAITFFFHVTWYGFICPWEYRYKDKNN